MVLVLEKIILTLLKIYRGFFYVFFRIFPVWVQGECKFYPTCSQYSEDVIKKFGPGRGSWLSLRRLARCHPWQAEGVDLA